LQRSQPGAVHLWTSSGVVSGYQELGKTYLSSRQSVASDNGYTYRHSSDV